MEHNKARKNERNLLRKDSEYNYVLDSFCGIDLTASNGACDSEHLPYLVNLYRDKKKERGAALETVPGYRMLNKSFAYEGDIVGMWAHIFVTDGRREPYIIVHKGKYLYAFSHWMRNTAETLFPIGAADSFRSIGFSYGSYFYHLDRKKITVVKSPKEVVTLGMPPIPT